MIQTPARIDEIVSPGRVVIWVPVTRLEDVKAERRRIGEGMGLMTLKKWQRRRSQGPHSQNNAIHGYSATIAQSTGHSLDEIKAIAKDRAIRRGYPVRHDGEGNVMLSPLTGRPLCESSANISVREATMLIEELQQIAAELDIFLPEG